jgi:hypothetical protein
MRFCANAYRPHVALRQIHVRSGVALFRRKHASRSPAKSMTVQKSRSATPDGARRDTAPTPEIRDGPL